MNWYENAVMYHIYPLGFCGAPKFNEGGEPVNRLEKVLDWIPHLKELYLLMVCKSLFSVMVNASMIKPCGLLSLRVALSNRHEVTRLRTVRLLSRTINWRAYVFTL